MRNAYVGIATIQGLDTLFVEIAPARQLIGELPARARSPQIGFWAVMSENDADRITLLLESGECRTALHMLDRAACECGRLFPAESTDYLKAVI